METAHESASGDIRLQKVVLFPVLWEFTMGMVEPECMYMCVPSCLPETSAGIRVVDNKSQFVLMTKSEYSQMKRTLVT